MVLPRLNQRNMAHLRMSHSSAMKSGLNADERRSACRDGDARDEASARRSGGSRIEALDGGGLLMDRRYVRSTAGGRVRLGDGQLDASQQQRQPGGPLRGSAVASCRSYAPAQTPGHARPLSRSCRGGQSDKSVDTATGAANDAVVREMMARGMRTLTGAATTADAWRRFFDAVRHRRHQGQLRRVSLLRLRVRDRGRGRPAVDGPSASRCRRSTSTSGSRISWTRSTTRRISRRACRSSPPSAPTATPTTAATIRRPTSRPTSSARTTRGRT